ncbi:MAG: DNA polymerase III subunit gamma/tau C-terminal domain-containing protein, partial [Thalassolituus sp.]
ATPGTPEASPEIPSFDSAPADTGDGAGNADETTVTRSGVSARQGGLADLMSNNQSAAESEAFLQSAYEAESASMADGPALAVTAQRSVTVEADALAEALPDRADLPELAPHTWHLWVEHLTLAGLPMAIAKNSALIEVRDDILIFDVDPAQGALYNDMQKQRVEAAIGELIPGARLEMTLMPPRGETPDQRRHRIRTEALYGARQAIDSDPVVNQILNELGGQVLEDTIRPHR